MVASPKEVASRVRTNPTGELFNISCVTQSAVTNLRGADLDSFRLPARTISLSLGFAKNGSENGVFGVTLNLVTNEIEIIGKREEVSSLCSWLNAPISEFN